MDETLEKALQVRYVKLHFTIQFIEDASLPVHKVSALRGGMGEMLLRANCIQDRNCEACGFETECIVRRTMYSKFDRKPDFVTTGESIGYVLECENYEEHVRAGDELKFNLILFGKTIVYLNQFMQAFYMLGMEGLGKEHARFQILNVTNSNGEVLSENGEIYKDRYQVRRLVDYVRYRQRRSKEEDRMVFHTPMTLKYRGEVQQEFKAEAIMEALARRLYMLDCFEGIEAPMLEITEHFPVITGQKSSKASVRRYSSTHKQGIYLSGIRGYADLEGIDDMARALLFAGELIHLGKNTSFGFGRYSITKSGDHTGGRG